MFPLKKKGRAICAPLFPAAGRAACAALLRLFSAHVNGRAQLGRSSEQLKQRQLVAQCDHQCAVVPCSRDTRGCAGIVDGTGVRAAQLGEISQAPLRSLDAAGSRRIEALDGGANRGVQREAEGVKKCAADVADI